MTELRNRATLPTLFSIIIVDLIGFGIVMPILPFYAERFGASSTQLGGLLAIHAAMQFVFAPIWGRVSDRIGRRPVMLGTVAGTGVSLVVLAYAPSLAWLFVARALSGVFAANISVATAYLTDVTAPEERTRWMGMVGASFGIGFLLGPAIGGLLAGFGACSCLLLVLGGLLIHRFSQFMGSLGEFLTHAFNLISILAFHGLSQRGSRFFYFGFRFAINFIAEFLD